MARKKKHDSGICFGCRLSALINELYPNGPQNSEELRDIMEGLIQCSGHMLRHTDRKGITVFFTKVLDEFMESSIATSSSIH
jgi:hypothetical protein